MASPDCSPRCSDHLHAAQRAVEAAAAARLGCSVQGGIEEEAEGTLGAAEAAIGVQVGTAAAPGRPSQRRCPPTGFVVAQERRPLGPLDPFLLLSKYHQTLLGLLSCLLLPLHNLP